jgi:hypothetical protein
MPLESLVYLHQLQELPVQPGAICSDPAFFSAWRLTQLKLWELAELHDQFQLIIHNVTAKWGITAVIMTESRDK